MDREFYINQIKSDLDLFKVVALIGPRQVGKTTLANNFCSTVEGFNWETHYFDLEDPTALSRLQDAKLALEAKEGLVVIDEIQRRPDIFPVLRYLLDRKSNKLKVLILGSASRDLLRQSSESLAGRIAYIEVKPLSMLESKNMDVKNLWFRGGLPLSYLASTDEKSYRWRDQYIKTFLERDIALLGFNIPPDTMRRFWMMLVHNHGGILNISELSRSFGVSDTTIRKYLDILSSTFMIRQLKPYYANIKKRQVKSPKIYFRDSGILHNLAGIKTQVALETHIKCGSSWEGFALEEVIRIGNYTPEQCYFWAVHQQGEVDLLVEENGELLGYEFKYSSAPKLTKQAKKNIDLLGLKSLKIVAPVSCGYQISPKVHVTTLGELV